MSGSTALPHAFTVPPGAHPPLKPQSSLRSLGSPSDAFMSGTHSPREIALGSHGPRFPAAASGTGPGPAAYGSPMPARLIKGASVRLTHGRELFGSMDHASRSTSTSVPAPGAYGVPEGPPLRGHGQPPSLKSRREAPHTRGAGTPAPDFYQRPGALGACPLSTQPALTGPKFSRARSAGASAAAARSGGGGGAGAGYSAHLALHQDCRLSTRSGSPACSLFSRRDAPGAAAAAAGGPGLLLPVGACGRQPESTKRTAPSAGLKGR